MFGEPLINFIPCALSALSISRLKPLLIQCLRLSKHSILPLFCLAHTAHISKVTKPLLDILQNTLSQIGLLRQNTIGHTFVSQRNFCEIRADLIQSRVVVQLHAVLSVLCPFGCDNLLHSQMTIGVIIYGHIHQSAMLISAQQGVIDLMSCCPLHHLGIVQCLNIVNDGIALDIGWHIIRQTLDHAVFKPCFCCGAIDVAHRPII